MMRLSAFGEAVEGINLGIGFVPQSNLFIIAADRCLTAVAFDDDRAVIVLNGDDIAGFAENRSRFVQIVETRSSVSGFNLCVELGIVVDRDGDQRIEGRHRFQNIDEANGAEPSFELDKEIFSVLADGVSIITRPVIQTDYVIIVAVELSPTVDRIVAVADIDARRTFGRIIVNGIVARAARDRGFEGSVFNVIVAVARRYGRLIRIVIDVIVSVAGIDPRVSCRGIIINAVVIFAAVDRCAIAVAVNAVFTDAADNGVVSSFVCDRIVALAAIDRGTQTDGINRILAFAADD